MHTTKYIALAVYARSPAAYNALRSFRLLQLPSISILKQYKSSYTERPGEVESRLIYIGYSFSQTSDRMFLSWQTWDLLRFMHYGFVGFCEEFTKKHPGYTIFPIRLNGSAVETLFSQLKYASGRNLMSTNYAAARASVLIKGGVAGKFKGDDYRDAPLFVRQHQLKKK